MIATFVNGSQFSVAGDYRDYIRVGSRVALEMNIDGILQTDITSCIYNQATNKTLYTVASTAITTNLSGVRRGHTFVDPFEEQSNLAGHGHSADWDGGAHAFSEIKDQDGAKALNDLSKISYVSANRVVSVGAEGKTFVKRDMIGTENQVLLDTTEGAYVFKLPQDISTDSIPTFRGLILPGIQGVAIGLETEMGEAPVGYLSSLEARAPLECLRRNAEDNGYEFSLLSIRDMVDVIGVPEQNMGLYWDSIKKALRFRHGEGGGPIDTDKGVSLGMVIAIASFFGSGGSIDDVQSITP